MSDYDDMMARLARESDQNPTNIAISEGINSGDLSGLGIKYNPTDASATGEVKGGITAQRYYGSQKQIGEDSTDYTQSLKDAMYGQSANADKQRITSARSNALSDARAGLSGMDNTAMGEQNRRNSMFQADIENQKYNNERTSKYGENLGARISGTEGLKASSAGRELASKPTVGASYDTGMLGSVICTVMYEKGYMSEEIYRLDQEYGMAVIRNTPNVYKGYRLLADPIVVMMNKSPLFTKIMSVPSMAWANNMAGKRNIMGSVIEVFGTLICGTVGAFFGAKKHESR